MYLTDKEFKGIIRKAFKLGEFWGVTYSTWFAPTKKDHKVMLKNTIKRCYKHLEKEQNIVVKT